jgi:hypothetical protein
MTICARLVALLGLVASLAPAAAEPKPGDVFREHVWRVERWQRITWPGVTDERPKAFLPNAVNSIELRDVKTATRVEVQLELLQSHHGTAGHSVRVNGGEWIPIPAPALIPGTLGKEPGPSEAWLTMRYPTIQLPVKSLVNGTNTFEFTCGPGVGLGKWWPQSIVYAAVFRVYFDEYGPAPVAPITVANENPSRQGKLRIQAQPVAAKNRAIRRVDILGHYRGYDWRGEGQFEQWHYHTVYGQLHRHVGTAHDAPWQVEWDVRWVPAQDKPIQLTARVEDETGLIRIMDPITLQTFRGMPDVKMFTAHQIPPRWQTRDGRRDSCLVTLPEDASRIAEAKMILATWNGFQAEEIGINGTLLLRNIGVNHDLSYDEITVPVSALKPGDNQFYTFSSTKHHGIEVLWPGAVILARYAPPPEAH